MDNSELENILTILQTIDKGLQEIQQAGMVIFQGFNDITTARSLIKTSIELIEQFIHEPFQAIVTREEVERNEHNR